MRVGPSRFTSTARVERRVERHGGGRVDDDVAERQRRSPGVVEAEPVGAHVAGDRGDAVLDHLRRSRRGRAPRGGGRRRCCRRSRAWRAAPPWSAGPGRMSSTSWQPGTHRSSRSMSAVPRKPGAAGDGDAASVELLGDHRPPVYHLVDRRGRPDEPSRLRAHRRPHPRRRHGRLRHPRLRRHLARRPRPRAGDPQADDPLLVPVEGGAARGGGRPLRRRGHAPPGARASSRPDDGFGRVEAMVRAMFRLAARHPSMLGFLREVTRLGPPASSRLLDHLSPLIDRASAFLEAEMDAGRMRRHDPRLLLLAAYSMVTGHGDGGRGAPGLRRGADAAPRSSTAATSSCRSCAPPSSRDAAHGPRSLAGSASASRRRGEAAAFGGSRGCELVAGACGARPGLHVDHPDLHEADGVVERPSVVVGADLDASTDARASR